MAIDLHGSAASINFANRYPLAVRRYPNYNAPQVELVSATSAALDRPVVVVDVGAAVGDTALLLFDRCAGRIKQLHCVEGEPTFAELLRANLHNYPATIHPVVVGASATSVPSLARIEHEGTASVAGGDQVEATTLDLLMADTQVDVLKIDTDGYDGEVLAGAQSLLCREHPAVLFEWHPILCRKVRTSPVRAFEVLREAGYERWIWFTKFGQFSHFGLEGVEALYRLCETATTLRDWHYDVVALHSRSPIDEVKVADLQHWGQSGYGY